MNILYITSGQEDYQSDMLFHGLNELASVTIYTNKDLWYMFAGNEPVKTANLYGKGFSLYNRIKKNKNVETPAIIEDKIKSKFYDCVIYGSIHHNSEYLDIVLLTYPKQKIIFIDGEDYDFSLIWCIYPNWKQIKNYWSHRKKYEKAIYLSKRGFYFKRELRDCDRRYFLPISFAIPTENIIAYSFPDKQREQAFIVPGDLSTYIYDREKDYYDGYAISRYAITIKKSGWDCLRHYEILANRCIPYFPGIEKCPMHTMHFFPKTLITETNKLIEAHQLNESVAEYYNELLYNVTKDRLTTKKLAEYILSFIAT